jgi:hypothetical protein
VTWAEPDGIAVVDYNWSIGRKVAIAESANEIQLAREAQS